MYKPDLALSNLQWLMCHKTKPNNSKLNTKMELYIYCMCAGKKVKNSPWV